LLDVFGSGVEDSTLAAFLITVPAAVPEETRVVSWTVTVAPDEKVPRAHDTACPLAVQSAGLDDTKCSELGSLSFAVTACASDGPALVTTIVQVTSEPATTGAGGACFAIDRSASGCAGGAWTGPTELFPRLGSGVVELTDDEFPITAPAATSAATSVVSVSDIVPPGPRMPIGHDTVVPTAAQEVSGSGTKLRPGGRPSVTITSLATPGPAL